MNGLLSRVLQRATHPGGGLEPLRTSRAARRASTMFPIEEVREVVDRAHTARNAAEKVVTPVKPILPASPVRATDGTLAWAEERERSASDVVPPSRMEQAPVDVVKSGNPLKPVREHDAANLVIAVVEEAPASVGEGDKKALRGEGSDRAKIEASTPPMTREEKRMASSFHDAENVDSLLHEELQMPPVLEISIGHIEVQAAIRAPERPRTPPFRPRVSLHDFLARSGRR